jgi:chemotaxis protein CheD
MKAYDETPETPERERILVGVSEYVVENGGRTLVAYGLGASVAVVLVDETNGVGALTHTLRPSRPEGTAAEDADVGKYVDTAVPAALREMVEAGANFATVEARIVGGADIFELPALGKGIGRRNAAVAREEVERLNVPVVADAVGGDRGRTVEFDTGTGEVVVRTADDETTEL